MKRSVIALMTAFILCMAFASAVPVLIPTCENQGFSGEELNIIQIHTGNFSLIDSFFDIFVSIDVENFNWTSGQDIKGVIVSGG